MFGRLLRRLTFWIRKGQRESDLREEMETHRLLREEQFSRHGSSDAVRESRRALGNVSLAQEDARSVWVAWWCQDIVQDLRFGVRSLRHQPVFTATAVVTLAVGTAALAVVFSIVNTVLLRPVPYANAERLVQIVRTAQGTGGQVRVLDEVASRDLDALRQGSPSLEAVTFAYGFPAAMSGSGLPEPAQGIQTDVDLFRVLGTAPFLGRWPSAADASTGSPWVVITRALWRSQFDGRDDVIGKSVRLNGRSHTVMAVVPDTFRFPAPYYPRADLWVPRDVTHPSLREPQSPVLLAFGVLRTSASMTAANSEAAALSLSVTSWAAELRAGARPRILLMLSAGLVVFLIVCANLTNMLLSRGVDREREMTARAALGAGRWRLIRQMLTETSLVFAAGGVGGCVLAVWSLRALSSLSSFGLPRLDEVSLDWPVLAATLLVVWVAGLGVGAFPATQCAGRPADLQRAASHSPRLRRVQRVLLVTEVSMALVLLLGAGLLAGVAQSQARIDPGFDHRNLMQARVSLPFDRYPTEAAQARVATEILTSLRRERGIESAAAVSAPPGYGGPGRPAFAMDGAPPPASTRDLQRALTRVISDDYFKTLGLAAVRGSTFASPAATGPPVALVNSAFVRAHLKDREALGTRLRVTLGGLDSLDHSARTIVGVVPDLKEHALYEPAPPTIYLPMSQATSLRMTYIVRATGAVDVPRVIRTAVAQADPDLALRGPVVPMIDAMRESMALNRLNLALLGVLAAVAVLLSVVGVYGVTAHSVRHRSREIGIRLALGVTPAAIRRHVLADGLRVSMAGLAFGAVVSFWTVPALRSVIIGASALSVWTCFAAGLVLIGTVVVACDIPARRAARLDPTVILRGD